MLHRSWAPCPVQRPFRRTKSTKGFMFAKLGCLRRPFTFIAMVRMYLDVLMNWEALVVVVRSINSLLDNYVNKFQALLNRIYPFFVGDRRYASSGTIGNEIVLGRYKSWSDIASQVTDLHLQAACGWSLRSQPHLESRNTTRLPST